MRLYSRILAQRKAVTCIQFSSISIFHDVCACRLVSRNPDVGLEAVVQLFQQLSMNQRSQVVRLLTTVDDLNTTCSSIDET